MKSLYTLMKSPGKSRCRHDDILGAVFIQHDLTVHRGAPQQSGRAVSTETRGGGGEGRSKLGT
jgi:hypothetical protein